MTSGRQPNAVKIIAVGDELLEGRTVETNSLRIQRALGSHAVQVALTQIVPDAAESISAALERTVAGDLVFLTGGLGSTPDDITRDVVAAWAGVPLLQDERLGRVLAERWRSRGIKLRSAFTKQSQVPQGLEPVPNPVGSAPGLVGRLCGRWLVLLPGVPQELEGLLPLVIQRLQEKDALAEARPALIWRMAQIAEIALVRRCESIRQDFPELDWSWWLTDWGVDLRLADPAIGATRERLDAAAGRLDDELGMLVYGRTQDSLPQVVQNLMIAQGATLAVAESCTAGLIGGSLTAAAGSSGFFRGGILAYADGVKRDLLGVPAQILARQGAVSEATVLAMAAGCRRRLGTTHGLAVSGISGPDGGTEEKPVGTTWIAVATPDAVHARRYRFPADRTRNRLLTVASAVDSLRRVLISGPGTSPWIDGDSWAATP